MTATNLFEQATDPTVRADPYPIYARMRETPVARQDDGIYVVSTYEEVRSLLFDSRMSSQVVPKPALAATGNPFIDLILNPIRTHIIHKHRSFVFRDPPDHDVVRRHVMAQFTPERLQNIKPLIDETVGALISAMRGRERVDLIVDFAYPLSVAIICALLGVPPEDDRKFEAWSTGLATGGDLLQLDKKARQKIAADVFAISSYLGALIDAKRKRPADDILTGLATFRDAKAGKLKRFDVISTAVTLLVAGHETTVGLIANGMLALLRDQTLLARLRDEPSVAPRLIDEVLRLDPPVQFLRRKALDDIVLAGVRIPKDAAVILVIASANRDPKRFENPDAFNLDRKNSQYLSFGAGLHFCIGSSLARSEAETALPALAKRLIAPRLVADPPPYRPMAALHGPKHLIVDIQGVV